MNLVLTKKINMIYVPNYKTKHIFGFAIFIGVGLAIGIVLGEMLYDLINYLKIIYSID